MEPHTELHPIISERWSPRALSGEPIDQASLDMLFEAARWAASSYNAQPWKYIYAHKSTPEFQEMWDCLLPGNQPWTTKASVIFACIAVDRFEHDGSVNAWAEHDLGAANAQLFLQATHMDIYGHLLAGVDKERASELLKITDGEHLVCFGVLGRLAPPEILEEPFRSRETAPRMRKPLDAIRTEFTLD